MSTNAAQLTADAREFTRDLFLSFESGEQVTGQRLYLPSNCEAELVGGHYEVIKALANTDVGLIDVKDAAGNAIITQVSIPLSSALGVRGSITLATAGTDALRERRRIRTYGTSLYLAITTSKATAGGKVHLQLHFRRLRKGGTS